MISFEFEIVRMDPLSQTLDLLRPQGFTWKEAEAAGDWAIRFPKTTGVSFSLIAAGACRLELPGQPARRLSQGDFILLAAPPAWVLANGAPSDCIDFERTPDHGDRLKGFLGQRGAGPITRTVGGHFHFDPVNIDLLTGLLPPVVQIASGEPGAARLRSVLDLIDEESAADRAGRALVLGRLLEVMLVEAIRHGAAGAAQARPGLAAGLRDPQIAPALRALHADIGRPWTVGELAAVAGASRSVFAARFARVVGAPPIDYLLRWRMALAKDGLRAGRRLADVAFACGYSSASAFSTAFSRTVGCPPARYAADQIGPA